MTLHRASPARCGEGGEWPAGPGLPPEPPGRAPALPPALTPLPWHPPMPPARLAPHPLTEAAALPGRRGCAGSEILAARPARPRARRAPPSAARCPRLAPAPWTAAAAAAAARTAAGGRPPFPPPSHLGGPGATAPPRPCRGRNDGSRRSAALLPLRAALRGVHGAPRPPRAPPGALPPARPPARRRLPPAAHLPPRTFHSYLPRSQRTYSCVHCRAHLARHEELISKSFQGSHGRAYLFNSVVNVGCGPAEQRLLLTGLHSVADIFCQSCKTTLGWKYEQAFESSQKYKEGKFIIEMSHMVKENGWD
ncbi:protein yippee-like 4 [Falco naumanni]|uniref:protein yippee-like 4 n=1 Tax=Falco naumanni TaxID=148594 RepID=UPI001ADE3B6D|nr:protein yippee-like 4 [Falco naumanni]